MDVQELFCLVNDFLIDKEFNSEAAMYLGLIVNCVVVGIIAFVIDYIIRRILISLAHRIAPKTKNNFDDVQFDLLYLLEENIGLLLLFVLYLFQLVHLLL